MILAQRMEQLEGDDLVNPWLTSCPKMSPACTSSYVMAKLVFNRYLTHPYVSDRGIEIRWIYPTCNFEDRSASDFGKICLTKG